jgi:tetratricopeptide (TPR) repeat protein
MGTVYYFDGDYNLAEKELLAALAINDSYSKGLNNLGLVYWKMGKIEKAKEYYLKAMQGQYPYPGAYENMALLYLSQNNIDMAREWLETFFSGNEQAVNEYLKNYGITSGQ